MKASINWLKEYIDCDLSARDIADKLTMAGLEVQGIESVGTDESIEVEITSNRPDWLSHIGIAREIGAITGCPLQYPSVSLPERSDKTSPKSIEIHDEHACPFYSAVLLEGVSFGPTPRFIQERLQTVGLRSINLPVDLTNYILYEYGQPLHAFDADLIGSRISIRRATEKEHFVALNEKEYVLTASDLVICDDAGPIALAGIMGGQKSEVSPRTKNILLESAFFSPGVIRKTSREHLISSDSSYRFERRVDPGSVLSASERFISMLVEYGQVEKVSRTLSKGTVPLEKKVISFDCALIKKTLGMPIDPKEVALILEHLGLGVLDKGTAALDVTVPTFRADIERPIDLIEEIARIYGYDNIPETFPSIPMTKKVIDPVLQLERRIREHARSFSLQEIITFSLESRTLYEKFHPALLDTALFLVNPSNKELTLMRPALVHGMLSVIKNNINQGNKDLRFFEIARRYIKPDPSGFPVEEKVMSIALSGRAFYNWHDHERGVLFHDLKGVIEELLVALDVESVSLVSVEAPLMSDGFQLVSSDVMLGCIGVFREQVLAEYDIKQTVLYAELKIEAIEKAQRKNKKFVEFSKYPASFRDLSIIIPEGIHAGDVTETIQALDPALVRSVVLFDRYTGKQIEKGFCSLSFAIEFRSSDRTLSNDEVDDFQGRILSVLSEKFKAVLR
jgi:phenylalanyl-tRNA synthetase beta chain